MKRQYKAVLANVRKKLATLEYTKSHPGGDRDISDETEALMKSVTRLLAFHPVVLKKEKNKPGR